jgi:hypothetical protein
LNAFTFKKLRVSLLDETNSGHTFAAQKQFKCSTDLPETPPHSHLTATAISGICNGSIRFCLLSSGPGSANLNEVGWLFGQRAFDLVRGDATFDAVDLADNIATAIVRVGQHEPVNCELVVRDFDSHPLLLLLFVIFFVAGGGWK